MIPVRCFTCGKVIADKWEYFKREREALKPAAVAPGTGMVGPHHKELLDRLGLDKMCCRRHMLGHVDIEDGTYVSR